MSVLSIIIPVYNEYATIAQIIERVVAVNFGQTRKELIIIDDGSTDGTRELLRKRFSDIHTIIFHEYNQGKGAAIRTGLTRAHGDVLVIQDADLEYNPHDFLKMYNALVKNNLEVVYGSRVLDKDEKHYSSFLFHIGGLAVTWLTNLLYGVKLTDEATCYKMFTRKVLEKISLTCRGFEFCPELTGKLLKAGFVIHEVPISYNPRSRREGKKIKIQDGFMALWTLARIRFFGK